MRKGTQKRTSQKGEKRGRTSGRRSLKGQMKDLEERLKSLEELLAKKESIIEEHVSKIKYLQADFDNYRKAMEKEREKYIKLASERLVTKLLDVYENLERGIKMMEGHDEKKELLRGFEMTYKQLKKILEEEGLAPIVAVGDNFDPFKHEAVLSDVRDNCEEGTILEELQKGYILNERVIRYSKVKVSTKEKEEST